MQHNNNIQLPLYFPPKPPLYLFLEHLHGVDASGVIYCYLLLSRRRNQKLKSQEANYSSKGPKIEAESRELR